MRRINRSRTFYFRLIIILIASLISIDHARAANGTRMLGFSARDSGMAGATTASPGDTSCLVRNPAGLILSGNRIDAEYLNIIPHDVKMETQGTAGGISAAGRSQDSTVGYIPGADAGVSYRIPGTDKYPISVGLGAFTMSGVALSYPSSRLNIVNNVYDTTVQLMSMRIAPGIAAAFNDKFSVGAAANIEVQGLKCDLAKPNLQETAGSSKWDFVPGAGFTLGMLYKFNEMLHLGASYESHTWIGHHYKYKDVLPYIDEPPVINVGVSFKPVKSLEVTYDTRYIQWTDVKLARLRPMDGGFGWSDQWVFAVGGEYSAFDDRLKLRVGYNYGKSPIQRHVVFANALLGVVMEHHLTAGFSLLITRNLSLDFAWEHHFKNTKSDDGCGDIYSIEGKGTRVTAAADVIGAGLSYKF